MKTLFANATFHTMESETDAHRTMLVEDGRIAAFDLDEADPRAKGAERVDLHGLHVYPALIDAHLHLLETVALSGISVQLCDVVDGRIEPHNLAGIEAKIREHAARTKPGDLMVCSNCIALTMDEGRLPNRFELDEWTNGGRCWVMNIDGHSGSFSTKLLEEIGLLEEAPDGILAGPVHDANLGRITGVVSSAVGPRLLGDGIADFCDTCAHFGIGTVCAMDGTDDSERDTLVELMAFLAQRFPIDVRLFPQYMDETKLARVLPRMRRKRVGGCMKWELDGAIGSLTAAFDRPYSNGKQAPTYFSDEFIEAEVDSLISRDFAVTAHAIGETAISQLVRAFEKADANLRAAASGAADATPAAASGAADDTPAAGSGAADDTPNHVRYRIDHCEFPSADDAARICALKPSVTVQPGYSWMDKRFMHGYARMLDEDMLAQQIPLRDFTEAGVVICGSSDAPVQTVDPFLQMRGMREFYVEEQSLSAFDALATYTVNGGKMLDEKIGLLREGYEANFFATQRDLLAIEPAGLEGMHAECLFMHGTRYTPRSRGVAGLLKLLVSKAQKI